MKRTISKDTFPLPIYGFLWEVTFTGHFASSSGMEKYEILYPNQTLFVVTNSDSLTSVRFVLESGCDSQSSIHEIHTAKYLGKVTTPKLL